MRLAPWAFLSLICLQTITKRYLYSLACIYTINETIHMYIQRELRRTVLFSWSDRSVLQFPHLIFFLLSLITCKSRDKNVIRRPTDCISSRIRDINISLSIKISLLFLIRRQRVYNSLQRIMQLFRVQSLQLWESSGNSHVIHVIEPSNKLKNKNKQSV